MSPAAQAAWRSQELSFVQGPYVVIGVGVLLWALLIAVTRFPASATRGGGAEGIGSLAGFGELFRRRRYMFGVFAQFCYVGAQVGLWSYTIRYAQAEVGASEGYATNLLIVSLVLFMIGRFAGAALMKKVPPMTLLALFGAVNLLLCLVTAFVGGDVGMVALVATSFFMSIMFPTIFAASLRGLGELTKLGSSLVVMAIIGGAVLTAVMGAISDASGMIRVAMLVPAGCFVVVALFARRMGRSEA
jgi:FHS family L-fucose permease-like MFS transporter